MAIGWKIFYGVVIAWDIFCAGYDFVKFATEGSWFHFWVGLLMLGLAAFMVWQYKLAIKTAKFRTDLANKWAEEDAEWEALLEEIENREVKK